MRKLFFFTVVLSNIGAGWLERLQTLWRQPKPAGDGLGQPTLPVLAWAGWTGWSSISTASKLYITLPFPGLSNKIKGRGWWVWLSYFVNLGKQDFSLVILKASAAQSAHVCNFQVKDKMRGDGADGAIISDVHWLYQGLCILAGLHRACFAALVYPVFGNCFIIAM